MIVLTNGRPTQGFQDAGNEADGDTAPPGGAGASRRQRAVLHTLRPFAVAMAGAGEFDPIKD
jgi:hypothetical protein